MRRGVGREPPQRLLPLPLLRHGAPTRRLVGRDHHVDEPLEEVALRLRAAPPGVLERLVCLEERAASGELEPPLV